jgi:hypothetical protein
MVGLAVQVFNAAGMLGWFQCWSLVGFDVGWFGHFQCWVLVAFDVGLLSFTLSSESFLAMFFGVDRGFCREVSFWRLCAADNAVIFIPTTV